MTKDARGRSPTLPPKWAVAAQAETGTRYSLVPDVPGRRESPK